MCLRSISGTKSREKLWELTIWDVIQSSLIQYVKAEVLHKKIQENNKDKYEKRKTIYLNLKQDNYCSLLSNGSTNRALMIPKTAY